MLLLPLYDEDVKKLTTISDTTGFSIQQSALFAIGWIAEMSEDICEEGRAKMHKVVAEAEAKKNAREKKE
jgi:hypothetical protein